MFGIQMAAYWNWWIVAVAFMIIETLLPGSLFLWIGVAAGLVGVLNKVFPGIGMGYSLFLFAILSLLSVVLGKTLFKRKKAAFGNPGQLNLRGERYIGKQITLSEPIIHGKGRLNLDGSTWVIEGPDLPAFTKVTIVGVEGIILQVKPFDEVN